MADDQSRPSENEHQDAESEAGEAKEARSASPASKDSEREAPDEDEMLDAAETTDEGEAAEASELDAEDGSSEDASSEDLASEDPASEDPASEDSASEDASADDAGSDAGNSVGAGSDAGNSGASAPESPQPDAENGDQSDDSDAQQTVPDDVQKYERFKKMDGAQYDRVNEFLRERTYITAREWAIARLCADFRTETGVEMTKIGENLPELVPFMTDTYTPQAVNQARSSFENKVRQSGATFLYGAMSGFFTAEELDDMMYEVTEVAKFLLEVEGVDLSVDEELEAEDRISGVMREVQSASEQLRHDEMECPNCGHEMEEADAAGSDD